MHDDLLERRLRAALHAEADSLPFTITADELRRRRAARDRSRIGRAPALLLAAALGIGLVGLGAAVAGVLDRADRRPTPTPSFMPSAPIAVASTIPSLEVVKGGLPSLDAFLAPLDGGRIVRAQAMGPDTAPTAWSRTFGGPGTTTFAPITVAGSYRVYLACLGSDISLLTIPRDRSDPVNPIPVTCNGDTTSRDVGLTAGDALAIDAPEPASWRFAVVAPERAALHAQSIASAAEVKAAAGTRVIAENGSAITSPDYEMTDHDPLGNPGLGLPSRDAYRIAFSCAGPGLLTYRLVSPPTGLTSPVESDGAALAAVPTAVECDGEVHVDVVSYPFSLGADVVVDAARGTAYRMAASLLQPPVEIAKDGDGWVLGGGTLELRFDPQDGTMEFTIPTTNHVRLVVTCFGGTGVDVVVQNLDGGTSNGSAPCEAGKATSTIIPIADAGRRFSIVADAHGGMWLALTLQQAAP